MRNFQLIYKEARGKVKPQQNVTLRQWQLDLMTKLNGPVDTRKIMWYWENTGNVGKSWMATYLLTNHGATVVSSGKTADIAYLLDQPKIVVFDLSRSSLEHINYGVMEDIKNGRIFSPKYESAIKAFAIPHIVVFANQQCEVGKFSADRLETIEIDRPPSVYATGFIPPPVRRVTDPFDMEIVHHINNQALASTQVDAPSLCYSVDGGIEELNTSLSGYETFR